MVIGKLINSVTNALAYHCKITKNESYLRLGQGRNINITKYLTFLDFITRNANSVIY